MLFDVGCYIHWSLWCEDYMTYIYYGVNFESHCSCVCVDLCPCNQNLLNLMFQWHVGFFLFSCGCKYVIFVQCYVFTNSTFINWNIDFIIGFGISLSSNVLKTFIFIVIFLYHVWLDFNDVSHIIITNLHTYNNL
jgi:hypothetical protein